MRRSAIVVGLVAGWCVACSGVLDKAAEEAPESPAAGRIDIQDGPEGTLQVQGEDGATATVGANARLPDDLPIALPGAAWETQMVISTPEGTMITAKPPADATGLDAYFKGELVRLGCATPNYAEMAGMKTFQCANLTDFETLAVNFMGEGAEQSVQIVYKRTGAAATAGGAAEAPPAAPPDGTAP